MGFNVEMEIKLFFSLITNPVQGDGIEYSNDSY